MSGYDVSTMDASGNGNFNERTSTPYNITDTVTTLLVNTTFVDACTQWTRQRVFIEIYLAIALFGNIFSCYVILTTVRRRATSFITSCIVIANVCSTLTALHLLSFPFTFTQSLPKNEIPNKFTQLPVQDDNFGACYQTGGIACRVSGLLFGVFLYLPLVTVTVASIERTIAVFGWQMYKFRSHTVSGIMLTLFISTTFAVVLSFTLPAIGVGTQYVYKEFFKICWISHQIQTSTIKALVYFTAGIGTLLITIMLVTTYLMVRAQFARKFRYEEGRGNECTMLFVQCIIMKTKTWELYSKLFIAGSILTMMLYLPLTVGYILRYSVFANDRAYWFDLMTDIVILMIPGVTPLVYLIIHKPHRKRVAEIFRQCSVEQKRRISPLTSPSLFGSLDRGGGNRLNNPVYNDSFLIENYREPRPYWNQQTRGRIPFEVERDEAPEIRDRFPAREIQNTRAFHRDGNDRYPLYHDAHVHRVNPLYDHECETIVKTPRVSEIFRNRPNGSTTQKTTREAVKLPSQNEDSLSRILLRHARNMVPSPRQTRNRFPSKQQSSRRRLPESNLPVVRQRLSDRRHYSYNTRHNKQREDVAFHRHEGNSKNLSLRPFDESHYQSEPSASLQWSKRNRSPTRKPQKKISFSDSTSDRTSFPHRIAGVTSEDPARRRRFDASRNNNLSVPYYNIQITEVPTGDIPTDESGRSLSPPRHYNKSGYLPSDNTHMIRSNAQYNRHQRR